MRHIEIVALVDGPDGKSVNKTIATLTQAVPNGPVTLTGTPQMMVSMQRIQGHTTGGQWFTPADGDAYLRAALETCTGGNVAAREMPDSSPPLDWIGAEGPKVKYPKIK